MMYIGKALRVGKWGGIDVVVFKEMPQSSVLAGQVVTCFINNYATEEEAIREHPEAKDRYTSKWTAPQVSLSHLPDENDPVPGGMFQTISQEIKYD